MRKQFIAPIILAIFLAACRGGNAATTSTPTLVPAPTPRADLKLNTKEGLHQLNELRYWLDTDHITQACTDMAIVLEGDPTDRSAVADGELLLDKICLPAVHGDTDTATTNASRILGANP